MEQRPLRLGDLVDDYCTRERRVTNHVIVVLAEDAIRQTRCTTCDSEHPYKGAKEPRLRKKAGATLYDQVLAGVTGSATADKATGADDTSVSAEPEPLAASDVSADNETAAADQQDAVHDGWLAHRQLIRASLPRTDNEPPVPRPIPEFTMYQRPPSRGGRNFRFGGGHGHQHQASHGNGNGNVNGNVNGNANGNGPSRNGAQGRPGQPAGRPGRRRRRRSR